MTGRPVRPLRWHLNALLLATILPLTLAVMVAGWLVVEGFRGAYSRQMTATTRAVATAVDAEIGALASAAMVLARAAEAVGHDSGRFAAVARGASAQLGVWSFLHGPPPAMPRLFDSRVTQDNAAALNFAPQTNAVERVYATGEMQVTGLVFSRIAQRHVAAVVVPAYRDGGVTAAIGVGLDPARLSRVLAAQSLGAGAYVQVSDHNGHVIARSSALEAHVGETLPDWLRAATRRDAGILIQPDQSPGEVIALAPLSRAAGWHVMLVEPVASYHAAWLRPLLWLLGSSCLAVALALLAARLLQRRLVAPLAGLAQRAADIAAGQPVARVPASSVAEVEAVSHMVTAAEAALQAEVEAQQAERELLQSVLDCTPDGVFVRDREGHFVMVNAAGAAILQRRVEDVVGGTEAALLPPEPATLAADRRRIVLATGSPTVAEFSLGEGDATRQFVSTCAPWRGNDGSLRGIVSIVRDITEGRHNEARLQQMETKLQQVVRRDTLGALASGMAHELNQPLTAATNYLGAARRMLERPPQDLTNATLATIRDAVARASEQMLRGGEIIRRLREFVSRGDVSLRPEPVAALVTEAVRLAFAARPQDRHLLLLDMTHDAGQVLADRVQIQQVLLNLMRNALEAMQDIASPLLCLRVRRKQGSAGSEIEIEVEDSGPGLPPEVRSRLFQPFVTTKTQGTGIGLALCRQIVEAHGGVIGARDREGGGTIFSVTLPEAEPRENEAEHAE